MDIKMKRLAEGYAESSREESLELLRTLGKIPAPSRREEQRAAFCRNWFLEHGAEDVSIDQAKNVICRIGCGDFDEYVVFAAHTDVVFADLEPLPMQEDEEKLFAPGIGDDTSNLVNLMMAAKYLLKNKVKTTCGILIVANACEEGLGNLDGAKELFAAYGSRIKAFISFDGYIPQCCSSAVGSYRYRIHCKTTGGHSYLNFGEPNAIEILCALVEELYQIQAPKEAKTTYNVGKIEGGSTVNSVAQEAYMLYEFRSTSQECLERMEKLFQNAVESCLLKGGELTVELLGIRPGNGAVDSGELRRFTQQNAEVIREFYDKELDFGDYSTDSNVPLSLGIVANTIGTVTGGLAHTREEWIQKASLKEGLKIVLSLMLRYTE